jgi:hypothetical protein
MPYDGNRVSELTRASLAGGTCCWVTVPENTLEVAAPAPQQNAATATQRAAACKAIGKSGSA